MGQDPGAVDAAPVERVVGQLVALIPADFCGNKVADSRFLKDLGQGCRVAEHVRQPEDPAIPAELLPEEPLAVQDLPDQGLAGGQVAVRLHKGAALRFPPALRHPLPDPLVEIRRVLADVLVKLRLTGHETVFRIPVHQFQDRGKTADRLVFRHRQGPEPRHVDVGVAHTADGGLRLPWRRVERRPEQGIGLRRRAVKGLAAGLPQVQQVHRPDQGAYELPVRLFLRIQQARRLPGDEQIVVELFHHQVHRPQPGVKEQMEILHAGVGGKVNPVGTAGFGTVAEPQTAVVDVKALPQHAVHIDGELRIGGVPRSFLTGPEREIQGLALAGFRNRDRGVESEVLAVAAPDVAARKRFPSTVRVLG